jgi:ribosomal protein S27E
MSSDDEKYARYGLGGNPFRNATEHSVDMVSRVHANLSVDDQLASLKEEVFFKRNGHSVFLVGDKGMGKTHRVMVAHAEASQNDLFSRVIRFSRKNRPGMYQFVKAFLPKGSALFSNDKWQRELAKVKKDAKKGRYQPQHVAQQVAIALNKNTPSFVLIDDLDDVQMLSDSQDFLSFLFHLSSMLQPGVFLMVSMSASFASWLLKQYPQVKNLVHFVYLQPLTSTDAENVLSKWLESFRLVDGLHGLFPFSHDAVSLLNSQSHGNVSSLLDLSDMALTAASFQKAVVITDVTVKEALLAVKEQKPAVLEEKEKNASVSPELSSLIQQKPVNDGDHEDGSALNPVPAAGGLAANDEGNSADDFSSDIIDLTNSDEGGSREKNDGEWVDEQLSSFSKESLNEGIKDINPCSPSAPYKHGISNDDHLLNEDSMSDRSEQKDEWSRMKTDDTAVVAPGDNGSKTRSDEPASIMHQAKQNQERKKKDTKHVDDQSDETSTDTWEPVDQEEDEKPVEESKLKNEVGNFNETKEDKGTDETEESEKIDEEVETKDSSDDVEEKRKQESNVEQEKINERKDSSPKISDEDSDKKTNHTEPEREVLKEPKKGVEEDLEPVNEVKQQFTDETKETDEISEKDHDHIEPKKEKSSDAIPKEPDDSKDITDTSKKSHEIKQHRPKVMHHAQNERQTQESSSTRVLRVRCPECSKDFTIELDEHTNSLTCPFCGFHGEL